MEVSLDKLITEINQSQKSVINIYLFGEMGIGAPRFVQDNPRAVKDEEGYVYFPFVVHDEESGYFICERHEIYEEEADEEARAKFEIREQGILLMEIRLY